MSLTKDGKNCDQFRKIWQHVAKFMLKFAEFMKFVGCWQTPRKMWPNFARCLANVDILNYICTNYEFVENIVNFAKLLDFGAVQKCADLVDLKKMLKNEY